MPRGQLDSVLRHMRRAAGFSAVQELTDAELLGRYLSGCDEDAFATLVRRYGRLVRSVCRRVLHHEQDVDDTFQATFLVFASKAASIRNTTSVASWLYGVAYRTAMNAKRARRRRSEEQREVQVTLVVTNLPSLPKRLPEYFPVQIASKSINHWAASLSGISFHDFIGTFSSTLNEVVNRGGQSGGRGDTTEPTGRRIRFASG